MLKQIYSLIATFMKVLSGSNITWSQKISFAALVYRGVDASPNNLAPNEVGCAESVTTILNQIDPRIPVLTGTGQLYSYLAGNSRFRRIYDPHAGCIVISPTGMRFANSDMPNGHTGIYINNTDIMSNSSATGLWTQNYNRDTWRSRYYDQGKYPVILFELIK